jgi:hypothetical protein
MIDQTNHGAAILDHLDDLIAIVFSSVNFNTVICVIIVKMSKNAHQPNRKRKHKTVESNA